MPRIRSSQADGTLRELEDYDVVMWEKHGVFAKGLDVMDAFDQIDVLSKSAKIYIKAAWQHGYMVHAAENCLSSFQPTIPL